MKTNKFKAMFLFIFMPKAFNSMAVTHHENLIKKYVKRGGPSHEHNKDDLAAKNLLQASKLRRSLVSSLVVVFVALLSSLILSYLFVKYSYFSTPPFVLTYLFIGAFTILAVTLWQIGNSESASGEWLHEKVHNWVFKSIYTLGTFFLGLGGGVDAFSTIL